MRLEQGTAGISLLAKPLVSAKVAAGPGVRSIRLCAPSGPRTLSNRWRHHVGFTSLVGGSPRAQTMPPSGVTAAAARSRGTLAKRNDQPRIDVVRTEQPSLTAARRCAAPRCGGGRAGPGVGLPGRRRLRCGRRPRRRALDRSRGPGRDAPAATRRRR
jgi:hypothetical protein